jgi:hypothetical protein
MLKLTHISTFNFMPYECNRKLNKIECNLEIENKF